MDLQCLFLNCTLKRSPKPSNTQALIDKVARLLNGLGVGTETVRVADYNVKFGADMDEGDGDEWPKVLAKVLAADILVVATPVWLGDRSAVAKLVAERIDATTYFTDARGQHLLYGKVGGALATGEGDGAQHAVAQILYCLTVAGCAVPPNADCFWVDGPGGPGTPYLEAGGDASYYVNERARWMAHNLAHLARVLKTSPFPTDLKKLQHEAKKAATRR